MSTSNSSMPQLPLEESNKTGNSNPNPSTPTQSYPSLHGPVSILWDIENCPVPGDVRPEDIAGNIRMALRVHPIINGAVTLFSAYGDFNAFPRRLREGCQRTGVKLVDVPNGRKDAADKAILVDMFLFALDNPPPSSIMLISGDVDFAPALHILGQRGYNVILVIPSGSVSSALSNAGRFVWDWPSVARGEGFLPPKKVLQLQDEEESILYGGISRGYFGNTKEVAVVSEYSNSSLLNLQNPTGRSGSLVEASPEQSDLMWVQPGDLNGLKGQLVKLLELSGGNLPLTRLPAEYNKMYGRPLFVSEYGAPKLVNLLKKMADALNVEGKGNRKLVCLRSSKPQPINPTVILATREMKGKLAREMGGGGSSDELSDEERVAMEKFSFQTTYDNLKEFRFELQDILVSYSYRVLLGCFEAIYHQRYKRQLDYSKFGVDHLEGLLEKVSDIAVVEEEPVSKRKYVIAVGA